jgi:thiosulfate/3-mercaptopyruvate sulfurtransferase
MLNLGMALTTKIEYSHPEVLVDTQWVEEHVNDPNIRIVEVDYDSQANCYLGHIPGAILLEWKKAIYHPASRDILSVESYKNILCKLGLDDDKSGTIFLYGDFNNWFAAFAFWVFKYNILWGFIQVRNSQT